VAGKLHGRRFNLRQGALGHLNRHLWRPEFLQDERGNLLRHRFHEPVRRALNELLDRRHQPRVVYGVIHIISRCGALRIDGQRYVNPDLLRIRLLRVEDSQAAHGRQSMNRQRVDHRLTGPPSTTR